MLLEKFGDFDIVGALKARPFAPFPRYADRKGWALVLPETRTAWLGEAEKFFGYQWPALAAGACLHFQRTGENLSSLHRFWERRSALGTMAIAECVEGEGRYIDQIVSGIYSICEETAWLTPFDLGPFNEVVPAPEDVIVNLVTSETGALLAWVLYLFKERLDAVSTRICRRIECEINRRLIEPYLLHDDYWWMGFVKTPRVNNWNPWCNRNMLMCALLLDIGDEARQAVVRKAMRSLDAYLSKYPPDGCCDEGPMYWEAAGGGLHTCLSLLKEASGGIIDIFDEPIVREIGSYIYKAYIHDRWFVDFSDGNARVNVGAVAYRYGLSIRDENLVRLGASAQPARPELHNWFAAHDYLLDIFTEKERADAALSAPYVRDAWMWHTQVLFTRERQGTLEGLYLAAKAGHNLEAHNHNDVGNFVVYADGCPVLVDLGTEEYSAKTFSPQRFELWYLQSQYHNCPTVRGVMQHDGLEYKAKDVVCQITDGFSELTADIAGAYPAQAGIKHWRRTCRIKRGNEPSVEIIDDFRLSEPAANVEWNLMTPCEPKAAAPGIIELQYCAGRRAAIAFDADALSLRVESIGFMESRLRANWGDAMYRIVLSEKRLSEGAVRTITIRKM